MRHKYIRHSAVGFVIWPAHNGQDHDVSHADMAALVNRRQRAGGHVMSAGFVWVGSSGVKVEGRSESMNIGPLPDDAHRLRAQLTLGMPD